MKTKWLAGILALTMLLAASFCAAATPAGTLTTVASSDATTADPHKNCYDYDTRLQRGPYEGLVAVTETGQVQGQLATSWDVAEDGLTFTFYLQPGVTFSDGTPFNSDAVVYNFQRIKAMAGYPNRYMPPVMTVTALGDLTVQFKLEAPYAPFLAALDVPRMISPTAVRAHEVSGDWARAWLGENAVGTGPYLLTQWAKAEYFVLSKNPSYWRGWEGSHPEKIVVRIVPEESTRFQMLKNGEVDVAFGLLDDAFLTAVGQDAALKVEKQVTAEVMYIRMRNRGALASSQVREAMLYLFPCAQFWTDVLHGRGAPAHGFLSPAVFGSDPSLPIGHQDLEKAKSILAAAGYPGGGGLKFSLWIMSSYLPIEKPLAVLFQEAAASVGVQIEMQDFPSYGPFGDGAFAKDLTTGPDMFVYTMAPPINDPLLSPFQHWYSHNTPPVGRNTEWYSNPEYDALFETARITVSGLSRAGMYSELQRILLQDPPAVPIGYWDRYLCMRKPVAGLTLSIAGDVLDWYTATLGN